MAIWEPIGRGRSTRTLRFPRGGSSPPRGSGQGFPSGIARSSREKEGAAPPPRFRPAPLSCLCRLYSVERHRSVSIPVSPLLRLFPNSVKPHRFPVEMPPRLSTSRPPPRPAPPQLVFVLAHVSFLSLLSDLPCLRCRSAYLGFVLSPLVDPILADLQDRLQYPILAVLWELVRCKQLLGLAYLQC